MWENIVGNHLKKANLSSYKFLFMQNLENIPQYKTENGGGGMSK